MAPKTDLPITSTARDALIVAVTLCILYVGIVISRAFGRVRWGVLGPDDILAIAACVLTLSTLGMSAAVYTAGVGYDLDPNSPYYPILVGNLEYILQNTFAFVGVYLWALAFMKLSQCCLYWRVFMMQLKWWIIAAAIAVVIWAVIFTFVAIFLCNPVEMQWSVNRKPEQCMDQILVLKTLIMTNIVTDILIILLPIWTVWQLKMRTAEKITVICCFGMGTGCCIIGVVRFVEMFTIDLEGNLTGTSLRTFMLCNIELCMAGICTSLPMLRPFYRRWKGSRATNSGSRTTGKDADSKGLSSGIIGGKKQPNGHQAWVELDNMSRVNDDSGSSVHRLTKESEDISHGVIQMTTEWKVSRSNSSQTAFAEREGTPFKPVIPQNWSEKTTN